MKKAVKILTILSVVLVALSSALYYSNTETIEVKITDKERIVESSGEDISSKFIVYSVDEVFQNTDDLFFGKFNSTDYQNKLQVGNTYSIKVVGWRIPILSAYRNIIKIY